MTVVTTSDSHHDLAVHELVLMLETDHVAGLRQAEADRRLQTYGPNVLSGTHGTSIVVRALRQLHHPLVYVLLAAGAVTLSLGQLVDTGVIFAVVLVNAVVGFVHESRAEAELDSLRSVILTSARVMRDGEPQTISSEQVVPGDLVLVGAGDKIPADLRLTRSDGLQIDESALTGESLPVVKDEVALPQATPVADRRNMVYAGTFATTGTGAGVAVSTGAETELGEIHRLVGTTQTLMTPLTRKLTRFSTVLTVAILLLAAGSFGIGTWRGEPVSEMLTAAVALAVGAIPEGLPAAVTITLAIGAGRMARRRAVVRRLPAVETLGGTTVVCSDKTGTLTENQMTVRRLWVAGEELRVTGDGYAPDGLVVDASGAVRSAATDDALRWALVAGTACNDAEVTHEQGRWRVRGDPTEGALLVAAAKGGLDVPHVRQGLPRISQVPFSSARRYMATLHVDTERGGRLLLVKGAAERVVDLCGTYAGPGGEVTTVDREAVLQIAGSLARQGFRVLAVAMRTLPADEDPLPGEQHPAVALDEDGFAGTLTLVALHAMIDPPRESAVAAVATCRAAGISVKMITGDHAATATAVAQRIGLLEGESQHEDGRVLTGEDLASLPAGEYARAVERAAVLARVSPEQKLALVEALQTRGHVVAMTGDGVNDAPALRRADIGVAMGRGGTEVAKDAADMVLLDDDFATIEAAVEEGRGVFDNLTKFIVWTLPTNMGEGLVILVAILLGTTLPILPAQILWINMTTAVALGLMLAFEPKEPAIMRRPPRPPGRPLLTRALALRVLLVSALLVVGASWLFAWELGAGASVAEARTAAVNLFVAVEIVYLFSCRSLTRPVWQLGVLSNRWVLGGVAVQAVAQLALTYVPLMNEVFQTAPIGLDVWFRILAVAAVASAVVGIDKSVRRRADASLA